VQYILSEPEIMVQNCPDKVTEHILKCSDILKGGQTLHITTLYADTFIWMHAMKAKAH